MTKNVLHFEHYNLYVRIFLLTLSSPLRKIGRGHAFSNLRYFWSLNGHSYANSIVLRISILHHFSIPISHGGEVMAKIPHDPKEIFDELTKDYQAVYGKDLVAILLYGSAASGNYIPEKIRYQLSYCPY